MCMEDSIGVCEESEKLSGQDAVPEAEGAGGREYAESLR